MALVILRETIAAQWHDLIAEAEISAAISLPSDLESYLVFLLTRFTEQTHLADAILALDYLHAQTIPAAAKKETLRDIGDKCLLITGLFPQRADKRRVKISYFVELGQSSYEVLAHSQHSSLTELFSNLSINFVSLMDVLLNCRQLPPQLLTPLEAYELWCDTHSTFARNTFLKNKNNDDKILSVS